MAEHTRETTMHATFPTEGPTSLYVEIGAGSVHVTTLDTDETEIRVEGRDADEVTVEQRVGQVVVIAPHWRGGFFGSGSDLSVAVQVPVGSDLATRLGSADLVVTGRIGAARLRTGSGEVRVQEAAGDTTVHSGSGDVEVGRALGPLRVKTGSGRVRVQHASASLAVASGSGRVDILDAGAETAAKTGSGDVHVTSAHGDVSLTSASGALEIGSIDTGTVRAKTVSGDVTVAVPPGTPVWTDISCLTGSVRSSLTGAGRPGEGQSYVEVRATTVSGDVVLSHT